MLVCPHFQLARIQLSLPVYLFSPVDRSPCTAEPPQKTLPWQVKVISWHLWVILAQRADHDVPVEGRKIQWYTPKRMWRSALSWTCWSVTWDTASQCTGGKYHEGFAKQICKHIAWYELYENKIQRKPGETHVFYIFRKRLWVTGGDFKNKQVPFLRR